MTYKNKPEFLKSDTISVFDKNVDAFKEMLKIAKERQVSFLISIDQTGCVEFSSMEYCVEKIYTKRITQTSKRQEFMEAEEARSLYG